MRYLVPVQLREPPRDAYGEACCVPPNAGEGGWGRCGGTAAEAGGDAGGPVEQGEEAPVVAVLEDDGAGRGRVGDELDEVGVVTELEEEFELVAKVFLFGALFEYFGGNCAPFVGCLDYVGGGSCAAELVFMCHV